jgi:dTDP-4-dehydrorhamnose reductase
VTLRIMLTGADGQIGWELRRTLAPLGEVIGLSRHACDLASEDSITHCVANSNPDLIVNAGAYTAVDRAEKEPALAFAVNTAGAGTLARLARNGGIPLIHYSTDYVFDGNSSNPYTEADQPSPLSVYGRSKLDGELEVTRSGCRHLILRTSWIFSTRGSNFLRTIQRLANERPELSVVNDQIGAPTWARFVAEATASIVARAGGTRSEIDAALAAKGGVFHLTAAGATNWYGFAQKILELTNSQQRICKTILPIPSTSYPTAATRPKNSLLAGHRIEDAWGIHRPDWLDLLKLCVAA